MRGSGVNIVILLLEKAEHCCKHFHVKGMATIFYHLLLKLLYTDYVFDLS